MTKQSSIAQSTVTPIKKKGTKKLCKRAVVAENITAEESFTFIDLDVKCPPALDHVEMTPSPRIPKKSITSSTALVTAPPYQDNTPLLSVLPSPLKSHHQTQSISRRPLLKLLLSPSSARQLTITTLPQCTRTS